MIDRRPPQIDKATGPDTAQINAAIPEIEKYLAPLDQAVAGTSYLVGDNLTYADFNVLPMLAALTMFPATNDVLSKHKNLSAYVSRLSARPSFKNTAPPEN